MVFGCASQKVEEKDQPELYELTKLDFPINKKSLNDPAEKQKRLNYLKDLITTKNNDLAALESLTKDKTKSPQEELKAELLTNEILLLEAYQYGIQEGLDLGEIEVP
jgi:hypothetical protein